MTKVIFIYHLKCTQNVESKPSEENVKQTKKVGSWQQRVYDATREAA